MAHRAVYVVLAAALLAATAATTDAAGVASPASPATQAPKCPAGASVTVTSLTFDPKFALTKLTVTVANQGAVDLPLGRVGAAIYGPTKNADGSPIYDGVSGIDCGGVSSVAPGKTVTCRWALVGGGRIRPDGHNDDSAVDKAALAAARAFARGASVTYLLPTGGALKPEQVSATATLYQSNDFLAKQQGFTCGPSPKRVAARA